MGLLALALLAATSGLLGLLVVLQVLLEHVVACGLGTAHLRGKSNEVFVILKTHGVRRLVQNLKIALVQTVLVVLSIRSYRRIKLTVLRPSHLSCCLRVLLAQGTSLGYLGFVDE